MTRLTTFCLVFLSVNVFMTPAAFSGDEGTTEATGANWLTVQVHTQEGEDIEIQLPLSFQQLIHKVVDFDRLSELTEGKAKAPLAVMTNILAELHAAPPQEIVAIESEEATVKVATETRERSEDTKAATALKVSVEPSEGNGDRINVTVPLGILELVARCIKTAPITEADFEAMGAGPDETGLHLAVLVNELPQLIAGIRDAGPVDLVSVKTGKEEVRVWIE